MGYLQNHITWQCAPRILLLVGSLFAGLGFVALLPPFEGFDETAHYSYLQQVAQTGTWPRSSRAPMSAEIEDYARLAPLPPSARGHWTYHEFFSAPIATIKTAKEALEARRDAARPWRDGKSRNWQGQHPPLYYIALAPLFRLTNGWSLKDQLFALRAASYLVAWAGLCLTAMLSLRSNAGPPVMAVALGPAVWPTLFPMWIPEMARLGNDSFVLLLSAGAVLLFVRIAAGDRKLPMFVALGAICGLGLMTKATFIPPVLAIALTVVLPRQWLPKPPRFPATADAPESGSNARDWARICSFGIMVLAIGAWWYVANFVQSGMIVASNDAMSLRETGSGLIEGLTRHFSFWSFIRGLVTSVSGFAWASTWSFIHPGPALKAPLMILTIVLVASYLRSISEQSMSLLDRVGATTLVLFIAGLLYHALVLTASNVASHVGAWYLHSLVPLLAILVYRGLGHALTSRLRSCMVALVLYSPVYLAIAVVTNALYYAGCGEVVPTRNDYLYTTASACLPEVINRLTVLAYPEIAIVLFGAGWLAMTVGLYLTIRPRRAAES